MQTTMRMMTMKKMTRWRSDSHSRCFKRLKIPVFYYLINITL